MCLSLAALIDARMEVGADAAKLMNLLHATIFLPSFRKYDSAFSAEKEQSSRLSWTCYCTKWVLDFFFY